MTQIRFKKIDHPAGKSKAAISRANTNAKYCPMRLDYVVKLAAMNDAELRAEMARANPKDAATIAAMLAKR